jgi:cob(I)alamin adenosyltransferase
MAFRIYTKTGDKGETSIIGGTRLPKYHVRIEAYGAVDELNSWIGLIRDQNETSAHINVLLEIQDRLFTMGSLLAADPEKNKMTLPQLSEKDVELLESEIDKIEDEVPPMKSFVLPGGNPLVSYCHISRCVCRRAERDVLKLSIEQRVDELIVKYLNRLSDYLFTLSRKLAFDLKVDEIPWKPRL